MSGTGFIKLNRGEQTMDLMKNPASFMLLTLIALRAKRSNDTGMPNLEIGEAMVGDYEIIGLTRQQYRSALHNLQVNQQITIRTTNRGTIAKLTNTRVFDINEEADNHQNNHKVTIKPTTNKNIKNKEIYNEVIGYLNAKAETKFKETTKSYQSLINGRLEEGYTIEDFKKVIDNKSSEWKNTKYAQYLTPGTLFRPSHFDTYLNQIAPDKTIKKSINSFV